MPTEFSFVHAENQGVQAAITLRPPYSMPFVSENFMMGVNANLTLPQGLVTLPVNVNANISNLEPSFDPTKGWCFDFNGENSSLRVKNTNSELVSKSNQTTIFELMIEFYPGDNATSGKDWFTLISDGGDWSRAPFALLFGWQDSNRILTLVINGTRDASVKTSLKDFTWYDIRVTISDNLTEILVNNAILFSGSINSFPKLNDDDFFVGCLDKNIYPFSGLMQYVRVYTQDGYNTSSNSNLLNNGLPPNVVIQFNLDMSTFYWNLLRSTDGNSYSQVLITSLNSSSLMWSENTSGNYYYKVQLLDASNKSIGESSQIHVSVGLNSENVMLKHFAYVSGFLFIMAIIVVCFIEGKRSR